jgi:Fanconi anemia group M protein
MYNFYRWFPTGKIIFMAPTLPLVRQQVKACYEIMGIPVQDTALITGRIKAEHRTSIWKARRLFFCTSQTVQKDLENNRLDASNVVCVVLDEAHKATGKYPYCPTAP